MYCTDAVCLITQVPFYGRRLLFPPVPAAILALIMYCTDAVCLNTQVPFDGRRLLFPPVPAAILALIMYSIFAAIFPLWMLSFTTGGTVIGKNFPNRRSAFLYP
jgi:hypothetical protein